MTTTTPTTTHPSWCVDHRETTTGVIIHLGPMSKRVSGLRVQASLRDDASEGANVSLYSPDATDGVVDCLSAANARKLARYLLKAAQIADAAR